jgi:hypothetical protein
MSTFGQRQLRIRIASSHRLPSRASMACPVRWDEGDDQSKGVSIDLVSPKKSPQTEKCPRSERRAYDRRA